MTTVVAVVGTYPPRACGLATYTSNVRSAIWAPELGWEAWVVQVVDRPHALLPRDVVGQWVAGDRASLRQCIDLLNTFDAVILQHEFGLFAGPDGEEVLDLVDELQRPLVVVLHTALRQPTGNQRRIVERLIGAGSATIVHSDAARRVHQEWARGPAKARRGAQLALSRRSATDLGSKR